MSADVITTVAKKSFNVRSASDSKKPSSTDFRSLHLYYSEVMSTTTKKIIDSFPCLEENKSEKIEVIEPDKQKGIIGAPLYLSTNIFGKVSAVPYIVEVSVNYIINNGRYTMIFPMCCYIKT